jgi:hypothetical protein
VHYSALTQSARCWTGRPLGRGLGSTPAMPPAAACAARHPVVTPSPTAGHPDIRLTETQMHAVTADIGAIVASFHPTVQLNGTVSLDDHKLL